MQNPEFKLIENVFNTMRKLIKSSDHTSSLLFLFLFLIFLILHKINNGF